LECVFDYWIIAQNKALLVVDENQTQRISQAPRWYWLKISRLVSALIHVLHLATNWSVESYDCHIIQLPCLFNRSAFVWLKTLFSGYSGLYNLSINRSLE